MAEKIVTRLAAAALAMLIAAPGTYARTQKPPLHGSHWMAITGKPLAATAGAMMYERGGNAVDAACAMIAATSTLWDTLSWGGESQALIFDPHAQKVIAINALGVAPTGATVEFYRTKGYNYPPKYGPLAAVTPGTPGGVMVMLAEYGKLSLADVLAPSIELADGYPIEQELVDTIERQKAWLKQWPYSKAVMLPHLGDAHEGPVAGEMFRQKDLAATLRQLIAAERQARAAGKSRKAAIYAAYDRFYKGDIGAEFARAAEEQGGLITRADLAQWQVHIEEPLHTNYRGIEVYKLNVWVQGPVMLQTLNILENLDLQSMGYNSARYIHNLFQAMNLAYADRDFYYGDIYFPPVEPVTGLLSKNYAKARAATINPDVNDAGIRPGDPYPYQGEVNPYRAMLEKRASTDLPMELPRSAQALEESMRTFHNGTTSVIAADAQGWVVAVTPSGGWVPAVIAGHTGMGMSERAQSFVLDPNENPFNVIEPGKHPRATLTPSMALKDGKPFLAFAVQGGDTQDQNLMQFFLNIVEFGMTPQAASEAPNFTSYQMHDSFGQHEWFAGRLELNNSIPEGVRKELSGRGYKLEYRERTSGPINAVMFDRAHGTLWGASSNHGEDYGIAW